jgi:hypothetical protein
MVAVQPPPQHPETRGLLSIVLEYAQRGWYVFPLHSPGRSTYCDCGNDACPAPAKHPWTRNGLLDATCDLGQIARWWSKSWQRANIGVACGPSQLVVLDVDPRHGGTQALIELVKRHSGAEPGHYTPVMEALAQRMAYPAAKLERINRNVERLGRMLMHKEQWTPEAYSLVIHWYGRWKMMQLRAQRMAARA